MRLGRISPTCTEAQGQITVFCYRYPVVYYFYRVVTINLVVLLTQVGSNRFGQNTVYPVYLHRLGIFPACLVYLLIIYQRTYFLSVVRRRRHVYRQQGSFLVQLQEKSLVGIGFCRNKCIGHSDVISIVVVILTRLYSHTSGHHQHGHQSFLQQRIYFHHIILLRVKLIFCSSLRK